MLDQRQIKTDIDKFIENLSKQRFWNREGSI